MKFCKSILTLLKILYFKRETQVDRTVQRLNSRFKKTQISLLNIEYDAINLIKNQSKKFPTIKNAVKITHTQSNFVHLIRFDSLPRECQITD